MNRLTHQEIQIRDAIWGQIQDVQKGGFGAVEVVVRDFQVHTVYKKTSAKRDALVVEECTTTHYEEGKSRRRMAR